MNHLIIGVDPGKGGGIAFYSDKPIGFKMSETRKDIYNCFLDIKLSCELGHLKPLVFIEKVQMFHSDSDEGGKSFGINKLLANFECLQTVFEILEIPFILVPSQTWQKELGFKRVKGEKKPQRKIKYRNFAQGFFPENKINLQTGDAYCLLIYGQRKLKDFKWLKINLIDDYEPYFGWCNVEGCENEGANGGGCWRETGYWTVCSKHASEYREGKQQPKMKQSAIEREKRRGSDGVLVP